MARRVKPPDPDATEAQMTSPPAAPATGLALPLHLATLPRRDPHPVRLRPDAAARAVLAAEFGLLALDQLAFVGELVAEGRAGWRLTARLTARVVQPCVVTGAPVRTDISVPVLRRWLPDPGLPQGPAAELPDDLSVEPLRPLVDAGEVMREELSLALPDWPRAPGAGLQGTPGPGSAAAAEGRPNPFAALAALRPPGRPRG
jgi:uncharacterized metal-binding protein YceD (DUF177 family)